MACACSKDKLSHSQWQDGIDLRINLSTRRSGHSTSSARRWAIIGTASVAHRYQVSPSHLFAREGSRTGSTPTSPPWAPTAESTRDPPRPPAGRLRHGLATAGAPPPPSGLTACTTRGRRRDPWPARRPGKALARPLAPIAPRSPRLGASPSVHPRSPALTDRSTAPPCPGARKEAPVPQEDLGPAPGRGRAYLSSSSRVLTPGRGRSALPT